MINDIIEKLRLSYEETKKAYELANVDCTHWWNLVLLLERLSVVNNSQMIHSAELYELNFNREIVHLRDIRPDLKHQLNHILQGISDNAF